MAFYFFSRRSYQAFHLFLLLNRKSQMAAGNRQLCIARQVSEALCAGIAASLPEHVVLAFGGHKVKDHTGQLQFGPKMAESVK